MVKIKEKLTRLDDIVTAMEKNQNDIEASVLLFEEGMTLIQDCSTTLEKIEQKVVMIMDTAEEMPFNKEED